MKISIVIPNYNYAAFIGRTLESALNQNYNPKEIIVVDDGSSDNSLDIINNYRVKHPDVVMVIEQPNQGQASAINKGLKQITGDIVGWINSDDTYCENAFQKVAEVFCNNPDVDVVFGNINIIDDNDRFIHSIRHFKFSYFKSVFLGFSNTSSSNAIFWRRTLMQERGLLNPDFKCGLDNDFFSRITFGAKVFHNDSSLANFRKQPITKAAIGNPRWDELVERESQAVFRQSYNNLWLSKYLRFKYAGLVRLIILTLRRASKLLTGRIFKDMIDKNKYKRSLK